MGVGAGYTVKLSKVRLTGYGVKYEDQSFEETEIVLKKGTMSAKNGSIDVDKVSHPYWGFEDVDFLPITDVDVALPDAHILVDDLDESAALDVIKVMLDSGAKAAREITEDEDAVEYLMAILKEFNGTVDAKALLEAVYSGVISAIEEYPESFTWETDVMSPGYTWGPPQDDTVFSVKGSSDYKVCLLDDYWHGHDAVEFRAAGDDAECSFRSPELAAAIRECHDMYDEEDEDGFLYRDWLDELQHRHA